MTDEVIDFYTKAINEAQKAAANIANVQDGGSANLDTVTIDFTGWRKSSINKLAAKAGIQIGDKLSGLWKGSCFVHFEVTGQGDRRYEEVQAAWKKLQEMGVPASVFYQLD